MPAFALTTLSVRHFGWASCTRSRPVTSLESALLRILDLIDEPRPRGDAWHADLISRAASAVGNRPAILPPAQAAAADETRMFRVRATRAYDNFDPERITSTVEAADDLARNLDDVITRFRPAIDP
jgi:hypothetical protein